MFDHFHWNSCVRTPPVTNPSRWVLAASPPRKDGSVQFKWPGDVSSALPVRTPFGLVQALSRSVVVADVTRTFNSLVGEAKTTPLPPPLQNSSHHLVQTPLLL